MRVPFKKKAGMLKSEGYASSSSGELDYGKVQMMKASIKSAPKKILKQAASTAISTATGLPIGSLVNVRSVISTKNHIANLEKIPVLECTCTHCKGVLKYVISQKEKKLKRKKIASVPVASYGETTRAIVRKFAKSNQGKERLAIAKLLWCSASMQNATVYSSISQAKQDCLIAQSILAELFFGKQFLFGEEKLAGILSTKDGIGLIAEKLKSV